METKSPFIAVLLAITLIAGYFFYDDKITNLKAEIGAITNEYNEKLDEVKTDSDSVINKSEEIVAGNASVLEDLNNQLIKVRSELQKTQEKLSLTTGKTTVLGDEMSQMHDARGKVKELDASLKGAKEALNLSSKELTKLRDIFEIQNKINIQNNIDRIYKLEDSAKSIAVTGLIVPAIGVATLIGYANEEIKNYCGNIQNTINLEKKVLGKVVSINDEIDKLYQARCSSKEEIKKTEN